ncbi:flagellar biosynthetic protein FliO [Actinoplanes regularis]|uniref:flagellar biosynthetic protein FliO n=1 Tax=Actinoplanes regularis TaxID=52697 RepID=UPI0025549F6F|nr:flagellar biosynthetic protein FliO [Actinoplanes regularis]
MLQLLLQVVFSLFIVLFLMWGLARVLRRPLSKHGHGGLAVLTRTQVTRNAAVAVVRVADRALVLGVTEQQISYLGEAELEMFETAEPAEHRDHLVIEPTEFIRQDETVLPGRHPAAGHHGPDGSIRSSGAWSSALDFLRERTTRR